MHDVNGTQLQIGDHVIIECVVTDVQATPDYCNLTLKSVNGRLPDGESETMVLNSHVVILSRRGE